MISRLLRFQISILLSCFFCEASAQNLVPNGSFENFLVCPGSYSQASGEFRVNDWTSANRGTPDHFHACSHGEADVPHNWAGTSDAYDGLGYAGIFLLINRDQQYQEYLQCKLKLPLLKDTIYHIEFHYKLASYSRFAVDRIGLLLTDSVIQSRSDDCINLKPTLDVVKDSALTQQTGLWETASMSYQAHGGENFVTVGNFYTNAETKKYKIKFRPVGNEMLELAAYYYIDDVIVASRYDLEQRKKEEGLPEFSVPTVTVNTNYILRNIQFQLNSYKLIPPSFAELDELATFLRRNPKLKVQLFGHTDDQGSDSYNLRLSRNRASTVALYLTQAGVDKSRVESVGFGESRPLKEGTSEKSREINRRVEIRFIK